MWYIIIYYLIIHFKYEYENWGIGASGNILIKLCDNYIIIKILFEWNMQLPINL